MGTVPLTASPPGDTMARPMAQVAVSLTPAAEKFMRRMVRFSESPSGGFRLSVSPGGCSGLSARFSVEAAAASGDAELSFDGLRLFLPAESRLLLDGVTIDFSESPTQSGLTFLDPKASNCGCSSAGAGAAAPPAVASVSLDALLKRSR